MTRPNSRISDNLPFPELCARLARLGRLTLKELREILRDRRTIITLVLMPILLYPLLSIAFQKLLLTGYRPDGPAKYLLGVPAGDAKTIIGCLRMGNANWVSSNVARIGDKETVLEIFELENLERAVRTLGIDLGIRLRNDHGQPVHPSRDVQVDFDLIYAEESAVGARALAFVETQLREASENLLRARLESLHVTQRVMPLETAAVPLKNFEQSAGPISLASLIPVILILMTITGAVYPAIDLTAGERERNTLETLVAAPVPRLGLLFAKYVSVVTVAFLTATINLISMTITIHTSGMGSAIWGSKGLPLSTVLAVFGLVLLFAAFFSAVLLTLTSFARSFKEAQAYLIPLMMFSISPGLVGLIPGIKLSGWVLITPLLNIAILSRDLLEGNSEPVSAGIVVFSTFLFALAAISLAAHQFGSENVLYDSQSGWADLFRRAVRAQKVPRVSSAMFALAVIFPACFLLTNGAIQLEDATIGTKLALTSIGTALIFGAVPALFACKGRIVWTSGFRLLAPAPVTLPLAVLLGFSLWPFAFELTVLMHQIGFSTIGAAHSSQIQSLAAEFRHLSPVFVVGALAVVPAIFEEFFFRGFLFSALLAKMRPVSAIIASAVLFGCFHVIASNVLAVERFLPTTFLGLVLGWVCWKTGSVFPGMILHCIHNGFLTLVAYYEPELSAHGWGGGEAQHLPWTWLLGALVGSGVGLGLLQALCAEPPGRPASER